MEYLQRLPKDGYVERFKNDNDITQYASTKHKTHCKNDDSRLGCHNNTKYNLDGRFSVSVLVSGIGPTPLGNTLGWRSTARMPDCRSPSLSNVKAQYLRSRYMALTLRSKLFAILLRQVGMEVLLLYANLI